MIQKAFRRRNVSSVIRIATFMLLRPIETVSELIRRLLIIIIEDGILHRGFPIIAWLMCATSKGYTFSSSHILFAVLLKVI